MLTTPDVNTKLASEEADILLAKLKDIPCERKLCLHVCHKCDDGWPKAKTKGVKHAKS
jgi:hypothetical protein